VLTTPNVELGVAREVIIAPQLDAMMTGIECDPPAHVRERPHECTVDPDWMSRCAAAGCERCECERSVTSTYTQT
jgi:hypothetical protein